MSGSIDPDFISKRPIVGRAADGAYDIWGPVRPPDHLGIHGTSVAVDHDLCVADGACIDACEVNVFAWKASPGHATSERKSAPVREKDCLFCTACETVCPAKAIHIRMPAYSSWKESDGSYTYSSFVGSRLRLVMGSQQPYSITPSARQILIDARQIDTFQVVGNAVDVRLKDGTTYRVAQCDNSVSTADKEALSFEEGRLIAMAHMSASSQT